MKPFRDIITPHVDVLGLTNQIGKNMQQICGRYIQVMRQKNTVMLKDSTT